MTSVLPLAAGTAPASAASAFTSTVVNQGSSAYGLVSTGEDDFQASMVPSKPGEVQTADFTPPSGRSLLGNGILLHLLTVAARGVKRPREPGVKALGSRGP